VGFYRGKKARGETSFTEYLAKHGYELELTFFFCFFFWRKIQNNTWIGKMGDMEQLWFVQHNIFVWEHFRKRVMESEFFVGMLLLETYFWMIGKGFEKNLVILSSMNMKDLETWWMMKKLPKRDWTCCQKCTHVFFCFFFLKIVMEKNKNRRVVK
jgi:hypothetical protein